ncbi:hypothetical protein DSO57_1021860 [Entomophthora muscae]|uniref:Uncharacterized protein n=2 Tax=Entomophthora muscae TaxID=34485 RepID=A0ACC2RUA6_9FUNG|nr:hypothetical protein DSO57_1021860 [Entomophthora muscae]
MVMRCELTWLRLPTRPTFRAFTRQSQRVGRLPSEPGLGLPVNTDLQFKYDYLGFKLKQAGYVSHKLPKVTIPDLLRLGTKPDIVGVEHCASDINRLIALVDDSNLASLTGLEEIPYVAYDHVEEELEEIVDSLFSDPASRANVLEWILRTEIYSSSVFIFDEIRGFFAATLVDCCMKYFVFSQWTDFGDSFQNFIVQMLNDVCQLEAKVLVYGIIDQIHASLKEEVYNSLLECFTYQILPHEAIGLGNALLQDMKELGFVPGSLAYQSILGFNAGMVSLNKDGINPQTIKTIYQSHKKNMTRFNISTLYSLFNVYKTYSRCSFEDNLAILELAKGIVDGGHFPTAKSCMVVIQASEALLKLNTSPFATQNSSGMSLSERISGILNNANHIQGISSEDLFSILLSCYVKIIRGPAQMHVGFVDKLNKSLKTSSLQLQKPHYEAILAFYGNLKCFPEMKAILQTMKRQNIHPDADSLYLALNCFISDFKMYNAFTLYKEIVGQHSSPGDLKITQSPQVYSLMMIPAGAVKNLQLMKQFWNSCRLVPTKCIQNALCAISWYIRPFLKSNHPILYNEAYLLFKDILNTLEANPIPGPTTHIHDLIIRIHADLCTLSSDLSLEDLRLTYSKYLLGQKRVVLEACYASVLSALRAFATRDPSLNPAILKEVKCLARNLSKFWVRPSCGTYRVLVELTQKLGDDDFVNLLLAHFQFMLSKDHLLDPQNAPQILCLGNRHLPSNPRPNRFVS